MTKFANIRRNHPVRCWLWAGSLGLATCGSAFGGETAVEQPAGPEETMREMHGVQSAPAGQPAYQQPAVVPEESMLFSDDSASDEPWTLSGAIFKAEEPPMTIGGWLQAGYHNKSTGMFNAHPDQIVSHQNYLYAERVADGSEGLDFGFRGDIVYGADAQDTQAFGDPAAPNGHFDNEWDNGLYGWALPQLYGEAAYGDLSVKVGHFYTLVGYEVVTAPDNFFYSHSFTMYNSEPFTHTGALATYEAGENATVYGGWVSGWDTGFDAKADGDDSNGSAFLGGSSFGVTDSFTLTYILLAGDMGVRGEGYNHSIVADWQITDKLNYVAQSDLVEFNNSAFGPNHTIGVNNFLTYAINDQWGVGGRAEWWKPNGNSVYQITGGLNYKPIANLVVRPEIRYQWGNDAVLEGLSGFNGQAGVSDEAIFGIDAILTF